MIQAGTVYAALKLRGNLTGQTNMTMVITMVILQIT